MLDQFARLFNIRRDELRRLTIISIMMVFFIIGYVWANITIISNFVSNLGTDKIPLLLIGDAVIIIVTFAGYSAVADRWANHHIMAGLAAIGIVGIVIGIVLLRSESTLFGVADAVGWTSFFLYLVFRSVGEAISTHWGPLVNDYFDTRAAKRIFTLLGGVVRLSYIVGALSLAVFNDSAPELILLGLSVWIVTLLGIFIMSVFMPRLMRVEVVQPITQNTDNPKGYWQNLYEGYQFAFKSYYLRAFVVASILMMILLALMQFEVLAILPNENVYDLQTLGGIYLQIGNNLSALNFLEKALVIDPAHEPTLLNRTKALFLLGYKRQALSQASKLERSSDSLIADQARALTLAYS